MNELIPGKRYRLSLDLYADSAGVLDVELGFMDRTAIDSYEWASVELLPDPLPTTPGSVVRWNDTEDGLERVLCRVANHAPWRDVETGLHFTECEVEGASVLFDAGVDRA